ncbi:ROK family protein [Dactylosporangium maewongense]|uniref:ROK family protein n=1 Tax=Dactylosporangium maewongense TaxID=634393 RepID=A0ABP4PAE4_9ACTN
MVALDVGGTDVKAAIVAADHTVIHRVRRPTRREHGVESVLATITATAADLAAECRRQTGRAPLAAGVVVPGIVDERTGRAVFSANLGWRDLPLRDLLTQQLDLPVALGHDVRAGGIAEGRLGAARGVDEFVFVALGTGVAAAHVVGGRAQRGAHGGQGELGHLVIRRWGPRCGCGNVGCLETYASADAIARQYMRTAGTLSDPRTDISAEQVSRLALADDPVAGAVWSQAVAALADGLVACVTLYDPALIVIGGGLARSGPALFDPLRAALADRLTFQPHPEVVAAELGSEAGCRGAALLAQDLITSAAWHPAAEATA